MKQSEPFIIQYEHHTCLASTNQYLKQLAAEGAREGRMVIADYQTAGRGRLGRSFFSPSSTGLYCSLLLRPQLPPKEALSITTAAAVAVAEAIESLIQDNIQIKWVNDLYRNGKKICGILTEAAFSSDTTMEYAVLGIGINLEEPKDGFPEELREKAAALFPYGTMPAAFRSSLLQLIPKKLIPYYTTLPSHDYMEKYRSRSLLTGKQVSFTYRNQPCSGLVTGIDDDANLLVTDMNGVNLTLSSGEVSVLLQ